MPSRDYRLLYERAKNDLQDALAPIPMILHCPQCRMRHVDKGNFQHLRHHTHACQHCGFVWRPAVAFTVGVQFLPGFKNEDSNTYDPSVQTK